MSDAVETRKQPNAPQYVHHVLKLSKNVQYCCCVFVYLFIMQGLIWPFCCCIWWMVCTLWWIFCVFILSSFMEDLKAALESVLHFAACCEGFPLSLKASCSHHQCLSCMFGPFQAASLLFFGHNLPYSWFASLLFWEFEPKYGLLDTETASKCKCFSLAKEKTLDL